MVLHVWRWWTENWSGPGGVRRARWIYAVMTIGFGGLAVAGGLAGEAAIAAIAAVLAVVTAALVVLAPRLAAWTIPPGEGQR